MIKNERYYRDKYGPSVDRGNSKTTLVESEDLCYFLDCTASADAAHVMVSEMSQLREKLKTYADTHGTQLVDISKPLRDQLAVILQFETDMRQLLDRTCDRLRRRTDRLTLALHENRAHPDYEYWATNDTRTLPDGGNWVLNTCKRDADGELDSWRRMRKSNEGT